jgi:superfamily I DNA/RNA helicase
MHLYRTHFGQPVLVLEDEMASWLKAGVTQSGAGGEFTASFLLSEWKDVIDARQIKQWEDYKSAPRIGRKTRLAEARRELLWKIFSPLVQRLQDEGKTTVRGVYHQLHNHYDARPSGPYDFVVVDEAQDIGVSQLQWLAAMCKNRDDSLFFSGDLGQRIFQQPFSWKACGVDIRGRSRSLKINYRTSHQIRRQADLLLDPTISDVDGNAEERTGTISVFNGPLPVVKVFDDEADEVSSVSAWLQDAVANGIAPHEVGVFVRSGEEVERALAAVDAVGLSGVLLDENVSIRQGSVAVATMHLAKGLEFKVVVVMACDDEVIPLQSRVESVTDQTDLDEVLNTERHLLYVACTRARDQLLVTSVDPSSEFLDDLER